MSIYHRHPTEGLPSLVTTNTERRRRVFVSREASQLLVDTIYRVRAEEAMLVLAFVLMPDHLHLILVPASGDVGRTMQLVKGSFARAYNRASGRTGSCWQSRYHERTLRSEEALMNAVAYVHGNPVAAGLVAESEHFEWSTASGQYETDLDRYLGQAEA